MYLPWVPGLGGLPASRLTLERDDTVFNFLLRQSGTESLKEEWKQTILRHFPLQTRHSGADIILWGTGSRLPHVIESQN